MQTRNYELRPYQKEILNDLDGQKAIGLFMGTGSGKTIVSIDKVRRNNTKKLLVICPPSIMSQWSEKILYHFEDVNGPEFKKSWSTKKRIEVIKENYKKIDFLVISFDTVATYLPLLKVLINPDWTIIVDESHRMKDLGTLWKPNVTTNSILELKYKTPYKILLTATPTEKKKGGYIDYFTQLLFIDVFQLPKYTSEGKLLSFKKSIYYVREEFIKTFAVTKTAKFKNPRYEKWRVLLEEGLISESEFKFKTKNTKEQFEVEQIVAYKNLEKLNKMIREKCRYYEGKNGDFEPLFQPIYFDKPKTYDDAESTKTYKDISFKTSTMREKVALLTLCTGRITGTKLEDNNIITYDDNNAKIKWLEDFLLDTDEIPLIFYTYNVQLAQLEELMKKLKKRYIVLNGEVKNKLAEVRRTDYDVILGQMKSASESIDEIQFKSHIEIFFSLPESSLQYIQALGRIDRVGQTKVPLYYFLISKETKEEDIYFAMKNKIEYRETGLNELKVLRLKHLSKNKKLI